MPGVTHAQADIFARRRLDVRGEVFSIGDEVAGLKQDLAAVGKSISLANITGMPSYGKFSCYRHGADAGATNFLTRGAL